MTTDVLKGKKGLVVGIANENSIAWGCTRAFFEAGAELAITYLDEKAEPYVRPLAEEVEAPQIQKDNSQVKVIVTKTREQWMIAQDVQRILCKMQIKKEARA